MREVLIIAFLAINVVMPLRYYFGDEPYDERFAWRMFSPVRMLSCDATLYGADGQALRLADDLHMVWINLFKRGRLQVLEAYARKRCADEAAAGRAAALSAEISCPVADGPRLGICRRGPQDADGDGVPDGFKDAAECAGEDPKACFARTCGDLSPAACFAERCRLKLVTRDQDLCAPGAR